MSSIEEKIDTYSEEIENLSFQINTAQDELETAMSDESISLESIVSYKKDIFNAADAEHKIQEIEKKISDLNTQIAVANNTAVSTKEKQTATIKLLVETMNDMYKHIDSSGNIKINSLFTKRDETYSGSEATIFHLIKLLSFKKLLNHSYPIIIDSCRAEDLSTIKEESIIDEFIKINNQVILTTTLKQEEFGKYNNMEEINHIDYSSHTPSKLLSPSNVDNFKLLLSNLSIKH